MAHCRAMLCPQVTLSGDPEWPKVADAVIEAHNVYNACTKEKTMAERLGLGVIPGVCWSGSSPLKKRYFQ